MITLINGALSLGRQNGGHLFANWNFGNYDLTLTDQATLYGTTVLDHSDLTISGGPLDNNGTLIAEDGSDLTIQNNLTGSGTIVSVDSSVLIAGSAPTSETIDLLDHSQLYLGMPSLAATIDMDSTSEIHLYNPTTIADVVSDLTANGSPEESLPFHGLFNIHSLTPGYTPEAEFTFGGPGDQPIGVTIFDKPTPSTTSATDTIVGSTVVDPTGSISATDVSTVEINTAATLTSETISLDSTSQLSIVTPVGMQFLAPINMTAGSQVSLSEGINLNTASITEFPQLNIVDLFSGSTLEAQLHIHNESPGTTIWASYVLNGHGSITLTDSVSPPGGTNILIPTHVSG